MNRNNNTVDLTITKKIKLLLSGSWLIFFLASLHLFASSKTNYRFLTFKPLCPINAGISFTAVSCNGGFNGTATVTVNGGSGNYSYNWSASGQTTVTATGLPAGGYTVTITDNTGGCTTTAAVTVTQPSAISLPATKKDITCNGLANGTATANPAGGNGTYIYSWSDGQTAQTATGLAAGTYTIKVTDQKGCTQTASVSLTQPPVLSVTATHTNVSCKGGSNGSVTAAPAGGTTAYTYAWSGTVQTGATVLSLGAATLIVTVTDANGCTATSSTTITEPLALTATPSKTNVLCFGGNTGTASVVAGGGITGYTYLWSTAPPQTTANATGLTIGNYTVTVTDNNACTISTSVTITQPTVLTATSSKTNVLCFGGSTGTATVAAGGGITGYSYLWNSAPAQTTANATGLPIGNYTVTVTDNNACTITTSVTITQPTVLTAPVTVVNLTCYNYGNGKATATPGGGIPAYTYNWSVGGQTTPAAINLPAGSYTVTVTDNNNCIVVSTVTVTEPPAPIKSKTGKNISCKGQNDGKAWVTPDGSKPPYIYAWTPSLSLNDTIFSLTAGTYSVTVTDAMGCKQSTSIIITEPSLLTGTGSSTNSSCNGTKDGTVTIVPAGGTPNYTYSWNTSPAQTTATATNLGPGTYTIKLTDSHACEFYTTVIVSEAPPLFINAPIITKETCLLGNGKVDMSVLGGNPPYVYVWSAPANTQTTAIATNLSAGTYTVTVTDSKSCSTTKSATITNQFSPPTAFATTVNNVLCFGAKNGTALVTPSAGTTPYVFNWAPAGGIGSTASNLSPGTYSVTVTDANGCSVTSSATITEPPAIVLNPSSTDVTCGAANGTASVAPTGGTLPYTIAWPNATTGTSVSNLAAGNYIVTVTDAKNCSVTKSITINNANPIVVNIVSTNVTCNGAANGTATVSATGAGGTFNYNWAPSGGAGTNATNLAPGTYTVTATDAGNPGCFGTSTVTITEPAVLTAPLTPVNISCAGSNSGQISVAPAGGTGPYNYLWSTGGVTATITGLAAGGYTVTVTDAKGCTVITNGTIVQGALMTANITKTDVQCFGQNTGEAVVNAAGGGGSYSYNWAPSGGTGTTAFSLPAGNYTVTVTDGGGCTKTATVNITQPPNFAITTSKTDATCASNNGTATVNPTGGVTPYVYSWSSGGAAATETTLGPGSYTIMVTDANSCTKSATVVIIVTNPLLVPFTKTDVTCNGAADGTATINTTGGTGNYNYNWSPGAYVTSSVTGLAPGTYTVTITDTGNPACPVTTTISITEPALLDANVTGVNISCNGSNNGQAISSPTGGTGPFNYNWSNSNTSNSMTGLGAGTYTVTVTDSKNCTATATIAITQGSALVVSITSQVDVTCFGLSNGSAIINASGGTGTLTYLWSPSGGTGATATGLTAGTYTVNINDASNCASTKTIVITEPPDLVLTPSTTIASCGGTDGTATITPTGGATPYAYNWSPGGASSVVTNLAPGTYTVTVTDGNGCTKSQTATVNVGNPITLVTNKTDLSCNSVSNGTAGVTATGGTGSYNYLWAPGGAATTTITSLAPGNYTVTVTDAVNGACKSTAVVVITEPPPVTVNVTPTNIICYGQTNGTVSATPGGGTPAYSFNWSAGGTGITAANLGAGNYTVTVSDANGCTATKTATVIEPPVLKLKLDSVNVTCQGKFDGRINPTYSGGVPAYTFNWAPAGGGKDSIGGLGPGVYTLTITDSYGCTITKSISITEPPPFFITTSKKDPTCYNNNGAGHVSVTGGSGNFSFLWTPTGSTNDTITNLAPGTYQVHVTDNVTHCDTIGTITLSYPVVSLNLDSMNVTCKSLHNAKAWVVASGANAPYTYTWSGGVSVKDTASGLAPGKYFVTVHDGGGCVSTGSIAVTEPTALSITKTSTNVSCFAGNDGTAGITPSGGTPMSNGAYTYSWSSGQTTSSISGLTAGMYKITLTDSNSCVLVDSIKITQSLKILVQVDSVKTSCTGVSDGKVMASATGGTGTYSYTWAPGGAVTDTVSGLSPGLYTVTVTDSKGCVGTNTVNVGQPSPLVLTMNKSNVSCGINNGKASVSPTGSNGTYTYQWAPTVSTNDTIMNLAIGAYSVTVTDKKGCSKIDSVHIIEPNPVVITTGKTNLTCKGSNNGTVYVNAVGGSGTFNYSWKPGGSTTSTVSNLAAGTYTVTVTDQVNSFCVLIDSVNITEPTALVPVIDSTNVTCFGKANGTAKVTVTGGTGAYTYLWSNTATGSTVNNLNNGTYTVTVTDANACTKTATTTITQPTLLTAVADSTNISCNGYNDGQVRVIANGGITPYNYTWNPGNVLNDTIYKLTPGTFTVTVSDANNCTATDAISITQPPGMTLTMGRTNTACSTNIGTANVSVNGGSTPYTYLWSTGSTAANISALYKGTYKVTVTDNKGCTKSDSVKVTEPNGIIVTFNTTNLSCNGANDGKITVSATGGTGSYIFSWIPSGNPATTLTGLAAGKYIIKVIDATNLVCSTKDSVTITEPPVLTTAVSQTNIKCFGDSTGIVTATPAGGTPAYTFAWSPVASTGATVTALKAATYTVSITDSKGCTVTKTVTLTQPTAITTSTSTKQAYCGQANGEAYITANGGTGAYTYSWTPIYSANDTLKNLLPGINYVYVTDANGCVKKDSAIITLSNGINTKVTGKNITCFGAKNGQANVFANGGSGTFIFQWAPVNNTNQTIFNLAPGTYTISVTDLNITGCVKVDSIKITEPPILDVTIAVSKSTCGGGNNYIATANPTGGTPNYTYTWSFGGTGQTESNLSPGSYIVAVTDSNGCDTAKIFDVLTLSTPIILPPTMNNPKCNLNNGTISETIFGGQTPYKYAWGPITDTTANPINLGAGTYTLTVTDAYGCTDTRSTTLINTALPPNIIASANPAVCFGSATGSTSAVANAGSPPYFYAWGPTGGTNTSANNLYAGIYTITVTDGQACTATSTATVTEPPVITILLTPNKISCFGFNGGTVVAAVGGGTPGYSYSWSTGGTGLTETNLAAGTYYFSVVDANGCINSDTVTVTQPPILAAKMKVINNVSCNGGSNGQVKISTTGGTPGYKFSWSPVGGTDSIGGPFPPGSYSVTVIDSLCCSITDSVKITQPAAFSAQTVKKNLSCFGKKDGQAKIIVSGASAPYLYSWSPMVNFTDTASGIDAITYTITVIDSLGCTFTHIDSITQPPVLVMGVGSTTSHCNKPDGKATTTVIGGTTPYTYLWTPSGNTGSVADSLVAGTYTVSVTDNNGCSDSRTVTIGNIAAPDITITSFSNTTCSGICVGKAGSHASGGTAPYSYSWNTVPPQTDSIATNMCAGNYFVAVTDTFGCVDTANITITAPTINIAITTADTNLCIGQTSHLIATATGGTAPYKYTWNNGAFIGANYDVNPTVTTTYTVFATDSTGCPSNPVTIIVKVKPSLNVSATATPPASCQGTPSKLSVTSTGGDGNYTYTWQPGGFIGTDTTVTPTVTTTYTIISNDGCGTPADTTLVTVTVYPNPLANFISNDTSGCLNTCTFFADRSSVSGGDSIVSWLWSFGNGQVSTKQNPVNCYRLTGQYNVGLIAKTNHGCVDSITKPGFIDIHGLPTAGFYIKPDSVSVLEPLVDFIDQSVDAVKWKWDFGDESPVDTLNFTRNPRHTYKDTGRYCVWQVVTNQYGCMDSIKHCLKVYPEFTFYIPNAFSPNGDNINEGFNGKGTYIKEYNMIVFDRWGNLIFETTSLTMDWDGRANGGKDVAQQDVYVWKVQLTDIFGHEHHYIGHVTLVK